MKKTVLITLMICFSTLIASAQEELTSDFFLGKWYVVYSIYDGNQSPFLGKSMDENWAVFNDDDTHSFMQNGIVYEGTWTFNSLKNVMVTDDVDGVVEHQVSWDGRLLKFRSYDEEGKEYVVVLTRDKYLYQD